MSHESICSVCSRLTGFGDEDRFEPPVNLARCPAPGGLECRAVAQAVAPLAKVEAERDELLRAQQVWLMSPEAAKRLDGYRKLAEKCATLEAERDEARAERARLQDLHTRCAAFDDQPGPSCVTLASKCARLREALGSLREVLSHLSRNRSQFWWETNEKLALTGLRNAEAALAETDSNGGKR